MAILLIPTRNRPQSLSGVLEYLATYYPGTRLLVADGSADEYVEANRSAVDRHVGVLEAEYRRYPYEMSYFARILDALHSMDEPFVIMGSDDDFPMLELFEKGERFLSRNSDFVSVVGSYVNLSLKAPGDLIVLSNPVRTIQQDNVAERVQKMYRWFYPTTYAITRREHLIQRYERASDLFFIPFYDYALAVHDVFAGKIRAYQDVGFVNTRHFNHSYLRRGSKLSFLFEPETSLRYHQAIRDDLMSFGSVDRETAQLHADRCFERMILEAMNMGPTNQKKFQYSKLFRSPSVLNQIAQAHAIFTPGTPERDKYFDRFQAIASSMIASSRSQDNKDEPSHFTALEDQEQQSNGLDTDVSEEWLENLLISGQSEEEVRFLADPETLLKRVS